MKNLPRVFETKAVSQKAYELGIAVEYVKDPSENERYFKTFGLEVIEGCFQGVDAKLEIATYNDQFLAAKAFANGQEMDVPADQVEFFKSQIK